MKPMITISLTKEEAKHLVKVMYNGCCDSENPTVDTSRLLNDLVDLLEVKPWDL